MLTRLLGTLVIVMLLGTVGTVMAAAGPPGKVDICHYSADSGTYQLISVADRALDAHLAHGDGLPGELVPGSTDMKFSETCEVVPAVCEYSVVSTGDSYPGLSGSTVTPVLITNEDCSTTVALRLEKTMKFQQNQPPGYSAGWGGWSCVQPGYPNVVGGGYEPNTATVLQSLAWKLGASVYTYTYPTTPWGYTYGTGETGWIVQAAGPTPPTSIYALCGV